MKVYVATSENNPHYGPLVSLLQEEGFEVLDWRANGFLRLSVDDAWCNAVKLASAEAGDMFDANKALLDKADACVCLLPCGRSAHLEAGYMIGKGLPVIFYQMGDEKTELMQLLAPRIGGLVPLVGEDHEVVSLLHVLGHTEEWRQRVLLFDPFDGDFGDGSERTLRDTVDPAQRGGTCYHCGGQIHKGDLVRTLKKADQEGLYGGRYCTECCDAMTLTDLEPTLFEARPAQRIRSRSQ